MNPVFLRAGTNWIGLDRDFEGTEVNAIALQSNELFVAGNFSLPNSGITNLAAWNGTNWTGFDVESGTMIDRIATQGQNIFVSGWFTSIAGVPVNNLAMWNGTVWSDLGNELSTNRMGFNSLLVQNNLLYAGSYSGLDQWDGTNWSHVNGLVTTNGDSLSVDSMTSYRGQIMVAASLYPDSDLMRWDGTNWFRIIHPFASGFLQIDGNNKYLYGYGPMTNGHGDVSYNLSKWDGLNWFPLASGLGNFSGSFYGPVLAADENLLAVAGNFTSAGGKDSYRFGIWHEPPLPFISEPRKQSDGSFGFYINGSDGQKVEVQASDDLLEWNSFQTNSLNFLPLEVINPTTENDPHRFYRLRQVP